MQRKFAGRKWNVGRKMARLGQKAPPLKIAMKGRIDRRRA